MTNLTAKPSSVLIGDRVRWVSAEGILRGEIVDIRLGHNGNGQLVPWIIIEYIRNNQPTTVMICGTQENLTMLDFKVNFRDVTNHERIDNV